ncbi:unnamed protein product [Owenia fusiformis]|uniref:Uncharacterized protein n=1 Tax=Owenia fusiformis TaxID=6347 RepID=A0A8J1U1D1_OWEFU|nr:unnamed protein product [Owenia fusiformis]
MAALLEGEQYGLTSTASPGAHISVLHVKLTDSALKAIDEYNKIKNRISRRPSIKFVGSDGVIKVPIGKSSQDPEGVRNFQFAMANLTVDGKGSFDAIQQSRYNDLKLLGSMTQKITVKANDDIYTTTKQRMTMVKEEADKQCAKEIKMSGQHISKKIKRVINPASVKLPTPSYSAIQGRISSSTHEKPQPFKGHPMRTSSPNSSVQSSSGQSVGSHVQRNENTSSGHGIGGPHGAHRPSSYPSSKKSDVTSMPFRDRVIHLLALRSYRRPELLARLHRDGIRDRDRNAVDSVLNSVASLNTRDNSYSLSRSLYQSDVKQDWPFYTEIDKQLLKRRLKDLAKKSDSPAPSPTASTGSCSPVKVESSQVPSQKRSYNGQSEYTNVPKKQRVAHVPPMPLNTHNNNNVPENHNPPVKPADTNKPARQEGKKDWLKESEKYAASSTSETPDYISNYTAISTGDQRQKYKMVFNKEYEEYMRMHENIAKIVKKFGDFEQRLKKYEEGTEDYERIKKQILHEYHLNKKDPKYIEQKKRHDFLHKKLGYIKKLILEYDQREMYENS